MTVTTTLPGTRDEGRRAAVLEGLAAFARFLTGRPDLPLGDSDPFLYSAKGGTDEQNRAEVDRIAAVLGVTAGDSPADTHYGASRDFGGGVTYSAWTFTAVARPRRNPGGLPAPHRHSPLCPAGAGAIDAVRHMAGASIPAAAA